MVRLTQLNGPQAGRQFNLGPHQTVGRSPTSGIVLDDAHASREQGAIQIQGDSVVFQARDMSAQVFVNGCVVTSCQLRPNDVIQFGQTQFQLSTELDMVGQSSAPTANQPTMYAQPTFQGPVQQPVFPNNLVGPANSGVVQMPGAFPQYGSGQNINIIQQQNNTGLWVLLAVVFACPLMCIGLMAIALLPYTMVIVGTILLIWGLVERSRYTAYNYQPPPVTWSKIVCGGLLAALGALWLMAVYLAPSSGSSHAPSSTYDRDQSSVHDSSSYPQGR